jgi:hypothetical protein
MHPAARVGSYALGICLIVMAPLPSSPGRASGVAHALEEESIPAADLPTPQASPGAQPSPSTEGGGEHSPGVENNANPASWQQVPAGQASAGAQTQQESSPAAQPTDVPPAMEIGSLTATAPISDSTLAPLIATAPTPARAASLRITEQARLAIEKGNQDDAIRDLARAVSIDPGNSFAYFYLGRAYIGKKDYAQAVTFFKRSEIGVGGNPQWLGEAYAFEGQSYEQQGKPADAYVAYQKALAATPGNLSARVGATRLAGYAPVTGPAPNAPAPDLARPAPEVAGAPPPPVEPAAPPAPAPHQEEHESSDD